MSTTAPTPYLRPQSVARLRALDESAMRSVCEIHRMVAGGVNPDNSPADAAPVVQTDIPCRLTKLSSRLRGTENLFALTLTGEYQAILRLPLGTDVTTSDVIVLAGEQYEIIGTNADRTFATSLALALRLMT